MESKKVKNTAFLLLGALVVILCLVLVFGKRGKKDDNGITVVCSFYPVYVIAQNLLEGTGCNVVNMTENLTGCIHDYQMTTKDMKSLENASLLLVNGAGMESFLDNVKKNYPALTIVEMASTHAEEHNPHVWMNVDYEMDCIDYLSATLCKQFPRLEDKIKKNAEAFGNKVFEGPYKKKYVLSDVILEYGKDIQCICFNEAFELFTESLGLHNIAVFSLDENEQPSANEIAEAIEKAKKCEEVVVLIEEDLAFNADKIVKETGAKVIFMDPLTSGDNMDSYVNGMTDNLMAMKVLFE